MNRPTTDERHLLSPSWQTPNCVRHASHPNVLQELLYCFQGIDGSIVKFDETKSFTIRDEICFERSHIVYQLLELGFLFDSVKKGLNLQKKCMVSTGLSQALEDKLNRYHLHVAELHAQERSVDGGTDLVLLTQILPWAREKMLVLQFFINILDSTKSLKGGAVLNPILRHLPHGNKKLRENFEDLFQAASVPLYQMIWYWIVRGTIKDPYDEFFVKENAEYARTKAWQCQFTLKNEYVPQLLANQCANLILDIGKCTDFINKFYSEKSMLFASSKKEVFNIEKPDLNCFVTDLGGPVLKLKTMHLYSSELVLEVMKTKYRLNDFFAQLREYIFLTHGHFASYFMELMHPYFYKTVSEVSPRRLKKLLHKAIRACSPQPQDDTVFENIQVYYNELSDDDLIVDVFSLQYKMEGPIKIMFQVFDLSYRKLFTFLWKKNYVLLTMSNTWKLTRALYKVDHIPPAVQGSLRKLFTMNFQLMRFMYQFDFYIVYEVVGKYVDQFFDKLARAKAIDEVVDAHDIMLKSLLQGTLLDPEHTEFSAQLTNIFSLVTVLEELTMSIYMYLDDMTEGLADETVKNVLNVKVEILMKNTEVAISNLVMFLKSCRYKDGLRALCDRINYNEFY